MAKQETRSAGTVARILGAARPLFLERSYADVTTERIARAAGVAKGGLYHHFQSKEQLYVQLLLGDLESQRVRFERAVAMGGSARERLARLTRDFLELPEEERSLMRLVRRDFHTFRGEDRELLVRAYQRALPDQIETILREGMASGELAQADPRLLAWSYVALVEVALGGHAARVLGDEEARLEHVLRLFFEGAVAPAAGAGS